VSWRICLEDLLRGYQQLSSGESVQLGPKTSSFQAYAQRLKEYSQAEALRSEEGFWREAVESLAGTLPRDHQAGSSEVGAAETVWTLLSVEETRSLLKEVPSAYRSEVSEVLLTALVQALAPSLEGGTALRFALEGHGREELWEDLDLTRTVGWFTARYPVRLELGEDKGPKAALRTVKEQLRRIPNKGMGYGVLRYLGGASWGSGIAEPELSFNYLGQLDAALPKETGVALAEESSGAAEAASETRRELLTINAAVHGGALRMAWTFSPEVHRRSRVEGWAGEYLSSLRGLIAHCLSKETSDWSARDFPLVKLAPADLSRLGEQRAVEDIYPLSPIQSGLLFHCLYAPGTGVYFEQHDCLLEGAFDREAFRRAWQRAVERHTILRTAFVWEGLEEPLQMVHREVTVPWREYDWRSLPEELRKQRWDDLLKEDRKEGFELSAPPLMRLTVVRLHDDAWRLVWSHHHLLLDGWSVSLLLKEVMLIYEGYVQGREIPLDSTRPYRDYIEWLTAQQPAKAESFWKTALAGVSAPTPLGVERTTGRRRDEEDYGACRILLSPRTSAGLGALARRNQLTLNTLLLGAWALLLRRYSGEEEVLFGVTVSGRSAPLPGVESMLGLFVNALPMRVGAPAGAPLLPWLRELQTRQAELRHYEATPLAQIQSWSGIPHAGRRLFESLFVFENYPIDESLKRSRGSLSVRDFQVHERTNYPITVLVVPGPDLSASILFDADRFEAATAERMLAHLSTLLEAMVDEPDRAVVDLPLMSAPERRELLVDLPGGEPAEPFPGGTIHGLFEERAELAPDSIAVLSDDRHLTYRELNQRSSRWADRLRTRGVGAEVRVAICLERSIEMVTSILAVLKAGACYVPVDPSYPDERRAFLLEDSRAAFLLTAKGLPGGANGSLASIELESLERESGRRDSRSETQPAVQLAGEELVYVLYTSGSTGTPKGVAMSARAIFNLLWWQRSDFGEQAAARRTLQFAPYGFDVSFQEIFSTLGCGGTLVLIPEEARRDPALCLSTLSRDGVERVFMPFVALSQLTEASALLPHTSLAIREILTAGEQLQLTTRIGEFVGGLDGAKLQNQYGPTESHVVSAFTLKGSPAEWRGLPPIGRPIPGVDLHVLDGTREPVPVGLSGELCIGGVAIARGYLDRAGETAERFIPHPFGRVPGARLYATGDLARWGAEGQLEFLGRIDAQLKIRGFRVEPAEIELQLSRHPGVAQAAVAAREEDGGGKRLVAYIVAGGRDAEAPASVELRRYLLSRLPEHMVPATFVVLDRLPLTPSGKIDRRALPAPNGARPDLETAFVAPRTAAERTLVKVWEETLGVSQAGVRDNFFELGGDSIIALQVISRAAREGIRLSPRQIFQYPTIEALAEFAVEGIPIQAEQGPVVGPVPLTPIQRWFFHRDLPDHHQWNMAVLLDLRQRIGPARLAAAVDAVVAHHDALRLRFQPTSSGWHQHMVEPRSGGVFCRIDLSGLAPDARGAAAEQAKVALNSSLDLQNGPLIRVALIEGGQRDQVLIVIHHLAVDGVSWRILLEDLLTAVRALERTGRAELLPKTTSFKHWAERLSVYSRSGALDRETDFWRGLAETDFHPLPLDHVEGRNDVGSCETVVVALPQEETRALLLEVPAAYRTQINDVLLTAVLQSFCEWTGRRSLLLHLEGHGREELFQDVDLSRTVGWFTSLYPVKLDLGAASDGVEALKSVKEQLRQIPQRGIGYGVLRYLSEDASGFLGSISPEVSFNYLGRFDQLLPENAPVALSAESTGPIAAERGSRAHLLDVIGIVVDGGLQLAWTFSRNRHERSTIERLAARCLGALKDLIEHCLRPEAGGSTPSDFPLARLNQTSVDRLVGRNRNIEDVYPPSPMQSGLLFHFLYAPETGAYFEQHSCLLEGPFDTGAFRRAWQRAVERHAILRTAFAWEGLSEPVQIVHREVTIPWREYDWRSLSNDVQKNERWEDFLREDREEGFDLSRPPLMRLALVRVGDQSFRLVWSHHHSILDGWSLPMLFREVMLLYEGYVRGQEVPLGPSWRYRDFIGWLNGQDREAAERFWREKLKGFTRPTPLGQDWVAPSEPAREGRMRQQQVKLSQTATAALERFARGNRLTVNTVIQGAWALLLSRYSGREDVLFGATVSGRSAPLPGIESAIGLFINAVPVRAHVRPTARLSSWLNELQERQAEARQYEYAPLAEVQAWSDVPAGAPLFESLLAFENYPLDRTLREHSGSLRIGDVRVHDRTNYPLTLAILPGAELLLRANYDRNRFDDSGMRRLLGRLLRLIEDMASRPEGLLEEVQVDTDLEIGSVPPIVPARSPAAASLRSEKSGNA
jgi:amino acid adenylation domain-containing protein/non-ribosomal peptide synthase protein (TIGR01720 family)